MTNFDKECYILYNPWLIRLGMDGVLTASAPFKSELHRGRAELVELNRYQSLVACAGP